MGLLNLTRKQIKNAKHCRNDIERQIWNIYEYVFRDTDCELIMDRTLPQNAGDINNGQDKKTVRIGAADLKDELKDNVQVLIAIGHERTHYEQFASNFKNNDAGLYTYLTCRNNHNVYMINYPYMVFEVQAEYAGVQVAYKILTQEYGEKQAEQLILDKVTENYNIGDLKYKGQYYSKDAQFANCKSIQDIFNRFEARIKESQEIAVQVPLRKLPSDQNVLKRLLTDTDYQNMCNCLPNGIEQYKYLVARQIDVLPDLKQWRDDERIQKLSMEHYSHVFDAYDQLNHELIMSKIFHSGRFSKVDPEEQRTQWRHALCCMSDEELRNLTICPQEKGCQIEYE